MPIAEFRRWATSWMERRRPAFSPSAAMRLH
jgi:hypothetical protein